MKGSDTPGDPFAWLDGLEVLDAHHHFWDLGRFPYRWLAPSAPPARFGDKATIRRNFLPPEYLQDMGRLRPAGSVHVQANCGALDPVEETRWLQELAAQTGLPSAVVAEVDLTSTNAISDIDRHRAYPLLRGIRTPMAWDEAGRWRIASRPDVINDPHFRQSARHLAQTGLILECVVVPSQLAQVAAFAKEEEQLTIVINHFGTLEPDQGDDIGIWQGGIAALQETPNVFVKLSGLWTVDKDWSASVLKPFVTHLLDSVGAGHVMWGSNLPVERVNCPLPRQFEQLEHILADRSHAEVADIFGGTARRVYGL